MDKKRILTLFVIHFFLGMAVAVSPILAKIYAIVPLLLGLYLIFVNKNRNDEAMIWAMYYASQEVLMRMTGALLGYEMHKYIAILFLSLGILFPNKNKIKNVVSYEWILFILLLIPSVAISAQNNIDFESIRFVLAGPIALAVCVIYAKGRSISWSNYRYMILMTLLPLTSLLGALIARTPDFAEISFDAHSNFVMSGGFGPVHTSVVLGVSVLLAVLFLLINARVFGYKIVDILFLSLALFRLLLTFSRSGLYALFAALCCCLLYMYFTREIYIYKRRRLSYSIILLFVVVGVWQITNYLTDGMANNRFSGKNTMGENVEDITTGRTTLAVQELLIFKEHPIMGTGPGSISLIRKKMFGSTISNHTEYSRLLAEHGLFGLLALVILFLSPILWMKKMRGYSKLFFIAFVTYSLLCMLPAATRTTLPMLLYGVGFLQITKEK